MKLVEIRVMVEGKIVDSMTLSEVCVSTDDAGEVVIRGQLAAANLRFLEGENDNGNLHKQD